MIIQGLHKFLENTPPFAYLSPGEVTNVANRLATEFFPRDTVIIKQGGPPSEKLLFIKSGSVKVFIESEQQTEGILDIKGEGEVFGFISLITKEPQKITVVALEDTHCYALKKDIVTRLLQTNPAFAEYFINYLARYVSQAFEEIRHKTLFSTGADRQLFTMPVGEAAKPIITIDQETTIQESARIMARNKISSLVIQDQNQKPLGIVTDRDLREKVIAQGSSIQEPIKNIATLSLIQIQADESSFDAVIKMVQNNIHRLLVEENGLLKGIVTNHDLMLQQGSSPLTFANDILKQHSLDGLIPLSQKANNVLPVLLKENARLEQINKIITEINDRLTTKVLEFAEAECGPPPSPYCFFSFGSSGRKEQTFKTDQDNAIIYANPANDQEAEACRSYFQTFGALVTENLIKVGFPSCPGGYMASNPEWCQPVQTWKRYFSNWVDEPKAESLLKFLILIDMRPLWGKLSLGEELKDFVFTSLVDRRIFLGHMANMMLKTTPPLGFFKQFVVEKSGDHKDTFDLKVKGITPLMDAVRLFAMEKGVKETSTLDRIRSLKDKHSIVEEYGSEMEFAFEFIMLLRIRHQYGQMKAGKPPDNFINPEQLTNMEKKNLKEAFSLMIKIQNQIMEKYKQMIV
jgi:CBS domain-containing protein